MGRPPGNGSPAFRFSSNEVAEMENILREHKAQVPSREVLEALAGKFSSSEERSGKIKVQVKQVWNWFQNRRFALRARQGKSPEMISAPPPLPRFNSYAVRNANQAPNTVRNVPQGPQPGTSPVAAQGGSRPISDNTPMEFEAKSARDGAWYDVASFLSHRSLETDEPDVLVRFAGFGSEEDEWVNIRKHVRPRSLPCESCECVAILPGDLILCFQEGKEQALYYDAHVIDSQRRRHDVRGCRCRFLVRYDHDQSEEIVPLRKVCRRPETDYRLLQLQSMNESGAMKQQKTNAETSHMGNTLRVYPPSEPMPKPQKAEESLFQGNRPITTDVKIPKANNSEMKIGVPLKTPEVPPGFEAVAASNAAKKNNISGNTPVTMEVKSVESNNHEVIAPVAAEVDSLETAAEVDSLETKNPVVTPVDTKVKTSETKNLEASAGGVVGTSTVPPGSEAVTSNAVISTTNTDMPLAFKVGSLETKNPEVDADNSGEPGLDAPISCDITNSTVSSDTPVAPVAKSPVTKLPEVSACDAVKIPTIPPGFEDVASGNTPVAMEVESSQTENPEVTAVEAGETLNVPSCNAAVDSKTSADTSVAMEVDYSQENDPGVNAGDAGDISAVPQE